MELRGTTRFTHKAVYGELGVLHFRRVQLDPFPCEISRKAGCRKPARLVCFSSTLIKRQLRPVPALVRPSTRLLPNAQVRFVFSSLKSRQP